MNVMTSEALAGFPSPPADHTIRYGSDPLQFGELRLPDGRGPHPVMMLIHGGCWRAEYGIGHIRALAAGFATAGIATWAIEYRRVGDAGGGWPGTFEDVAAAGEYVAVLAREHDLDTGRFVTSGHSAGGHLALWYATRPSSMRGADAIEPSGVLALAPAADLEYLHEQQVCDHVVDELMGGSPGERPERYRLASCMHRIPLATPHHVVLGDFDDAWTPVGRRYATAAAGAGAPVTVIRARESGHFEMIDPRTSTWPLVLASARRLFGMPGDAGT